jgi:glucose-1-phosphate adenylyltransferase
LENTLVLVLAGGRGERLMPLTENVPKPLVRFGTSGRIIDFTLYNCLSSGSDQVVVLTQYLAESIEQYLSNQWKTAFDMLGRDLSCFKGQATGQGQFRGTADAVYQTLLGQEKLPDYVLVLASDHVYRMDYSSLVQFHRSHGGVATVAGVECAREDSSRFGIVDAEKDGQIRAFHEKPLSLEGLLPRHVNPLASMGIYVFTVEPLLKYLAGNERSESHDFGKDILPRMAEDKEAWVFRFTRPDGTTGYWRDVGDLDAYLDTSLDSLNGSYDGFTFDQIPGIEHSPFARDDLIVRQTTGKRQVHNSKVSTTALIGQAIVEDSIIGPRVVVEDGVEIRNSVVLDGSVIHGPSQLNGLVVAPNIEFGSVKTSGRSRISAPGSMDNNTFSTGDAHVGH